MLPKLGTLRLGERPALASQQALLPPTSVAPLLGTCHEGNGGSQLEPCMACVKY